MAAAHAPLERPVPLGVAGGAQAPCGRACRAAGGRGGRGGGGGERMRRAGGAGPWPPSLAGTVSEGGRRARQLSRISSVGWW